MLGEGQKMCTTCHGGADAIHGRQLPRDPKPKICCGACHDGIKWDTGTGSTLGDKSNVVFATDALASSGHRGGAARDDASCTACHTSDGIRISHRTQNITTHNPEITAGLASFRYEIKSAAVNATANESRSSSGVWQKISPDATETLVSFVAPAAPAVSNPLTGFTGGPSFLLPYAKARTASRHRWTTTTSGASHAQPR